MKSIAARGERSGEAIGTLQSLVRAGVTHFVDLKFPKGVDTDQFEPYEHFLEELPGSAGYSRHSIKDLNVGSQELMEEILSDIDELISHGKVPYVHCWGGVGRTGTVVACHLLDSGMTADEALEVIATERKSLVRGHRPSPETSDQEEFVRNWERRAT